MNTTTHTHDPADCHVPECDGTSLGHQLATEFPEQTRRFHQAMDRIGHPEDHAMPDRLQVDGEHEHVWIRALCDVDETCTNCDATRPSGQPAMTCSDHDGPCDGPHAPACPYCRQRGKHLSTCRHAGNDSLPVTSGLWVDVDGNNDLTLWTGDRDHPTSLLRRFEAPAVFDAVRRVVDLAARLDVLAQRYSKAGNEDRASAYAGSAAGIRNALQVQP